MSEPGRAPALHVRWRDVPLPWLAAQAACAGFAVALLYALGNSAFILSNGAQDMPYAYLWASLLIPPLCVLYNRLQRRWSVAQLSRVTILLFIALYVFAWLFAQSTRLDIAGYLLFVGYTLSLAFLTIVVTSQANRLFTPAELTIRFPQMLAVQTVALILCGVVVAPLGRLLNGDHQTLLVGAGVMGLMWIVLELTVRRFAQLSVTYGTDIAVPIKLEQLLRRVLPRWLLLYQVLSSTSTLLIMYLVPVMAQRVYDRGEDMTRFFGNLIAAATLGALLFLMFGVARVLLRWGMRVGLLINPLGVLFLLVPMLATAFTMPGHAELLLGFAAGARALDFILSIGTTETAVNAMIKRLPDDSQLSLINAVNAFAVPLSYGVAGVMLLQLQQIEVGFTGLVGATLVTCVVWALVAGRVVMLRVA